MNEQEFSEEMWKLTREAVESDINPMYVAGTYEFAAQFVRREMLKQVDEMNEVLDTDSPFQHDDDEVFD